MNIDIFFISSVLYFVILLLMLQPHLEIDWVATNSDLPTIPNIVVNPFLMIPMDTVGAFAYLQVKLPALINRITGLAAHTSAKHTEYYEACRRQENSRPPCPTSSSVRPLQPSKARVGRRRNSSEFEKHIAKAKGSMGPTECSGRKRRADKDLAINQNEPFALMHKRQKVTIEYDGHTQKVLEEVVQDIGICRSNIRRAKISMIQTRFVAKPLDKTSCLVKSSIGRIITVTRG